ncbi:MAG: metalloregulator ArsR/SmtB family transcription factor [Rudaea sp.]
MKTTDALAALSALSQESRLEAFRELVQAGKAGMPVGDLRNRIGIPATTLSAHLNILRAANLVHDKREGRVIRVTANYPQMNSLLAYLTANCCAGEVCEAMPCPPPRKKGDSK